MKTHPAKLFLQGTKVKTTNLCMLAAFLLTNTYAFNSTAEENEPLAPENTAVSSRIAAFNNHGIDAYLAAHHKDVEIFEFPNKPVGKGRSHLERIFGPMMERQVGSISVIHQTTIENRVISEEIVTYGPEHSELLVAIYTIEENHIQTIHLIEPDERG